MIRLDVPEDSWSKEAVKFNKELEKFVEENNWTKIPINKQNDEIRHYAYCGNEKIFNGYLYVSAEERKGILLVTFGPWAYDHTMIYVDRGAVATLFDEIIGTLVFICSGDCVTASLNVSFESPVLVGHPVIYRCQVEKIEKRKIFINSQIACVHDGKVLGRANAVFITKHLAASL